MNINTKTQTLPKFAGGVNVALWILQILTAAAVFLMAGYSKLSGDPKMVEAFANIGLGQWFRYVTGSIETVSALLLLVPRTIPVGALLLICTMLGAIATHLFVFGDSPIVPIILLAFNVAIFWKRYDEAGTSREI